MALELKKNPVPIFIQLKSNKQLLFHDIKRIIKSQLQRTTIFVFFLYTCIEQNLIPRGYKVKMSFYTSSPSQLLHDEHQVLVRVRNSPCLWHHLHKS